MSSQIFNRLSAVVVVCVLGMTMIGCAPTVMPTTQHTPISADSVEILTKAPSKYEIVGNIVMPVTPAMKWDDRADSTVGFDTLKSKAAAMGANAVLLVPPAQGADGEVLAGYRGQYYKVPMNLRTRTVFAQAIYVVSK